MPYRIIFFLKQSRHTEVINNPPHPSLLFTLFTSSKASVCDNFY